MVYPGSHISAPGVTNTRTEEAGTLGTSDFSPHNCFLPLVLILTVVLCRKAMGSASVVDDRCKAMDVVMQCNIRGKPDQH